jgi:hypothetical protein
MNMQREKNNNKDYAFPIQKSPKRAMRRSQVERIKARTKRLMEWAEWRDMSEAEIGRFASHSFTYDRDRPVNQYAHDIDWRNEYDL